jgi:predicted Rossmann fold nucleotide-binding protein DprA/Smf involved in DNA uptake
MKIAIVGTRSFDDYEAVKTFMSIVSAGVVVEAIVSGGAEGADTLGECYAHDNGIPMVVFKPEWDLYGKSAGMMRNRTIVQNSDLIVAFWDGYSAGTQNTINLAKKSGKPVYIYNYIRRDFYKEAAIATIEHMFDE